MPATVPAVAPFDTGAAHGGHGASPGWPDNLKPVSESSLTWSTVQAVTVMNSQWSGGDTDRDLSASAAAARRSRLCNSESDSDRDSAVT